MNPKPGYKSTEFWLTVAAQVVGLLAASGAIAGESSWGRLVGLAGMILAQLGYTYSRGMVKAGSPPAGGS